MMSAVHDPGAWMVIALVACVHLTYLLGRRFGGAKRWKAAFWLVPSAIAAVANAHNPAYDGRYVAMAFTVCMACGAALSFRLPRAADAFGVGVLGLFAAIALSVWNTSNAFSSRYIAENDGWYDYDGAEPRLAINALTGLVRSGDVRLTASISPKMKPGFFDERRFKSTGIENRGPFTYYASEPVWHSWITGLRLRCPHTFRLFIPSGAPAQAVKGAHLVEVPTPPEYAASSLDNE